MSARKHAKLRGLSPGSCGAAPHPSLPAEPSERPSSETGERRAYEACCGSSSAATMRGESPRAGGTRHVGWAVRGTLRPGRASARLHRSSPKMESERLVVRRKWAARSAGQTAFSIARTVCGPARAGSVSGSAVGPSGPGAHTSANSSNIYKGIYGLIMVKNAK
jgi:hypothetical protein